MKLILICGVLLVSAVIAIGTVHKDISQDTQVTSADKNARFFSEAAKDRKDTRCDTSDWNLLLVNQWSTIPDDFSVELIQLRNGHAIDERAYPDLQDMMDAMRAEGLSPLICSSYRTNDEQQKLYSNEVSTYLARGYSQAAAEAEAGKWVAVPGTSEHQTGLAVDIVDMNYQLLDEQQKDTAVQKWLISNSYKYGFILRYPGDKSDMTGINYEPWHYRYVGKEAAKEIYEQGICFEEYLASLDKGKHGSAARRQKKKRRSHHITKAAPLQVRDAAFLLSV